ncbi:MAG TPA: lytic transglycosylase [Paenibacillaceae bacterium]|nr:lytic transglycosylase [Paenibacillaceae bacterium]
MELMKKKRYVVSLIILLVTFILLDSSLVLKIIFPVSYKQEIKNSAAHHNVDPYLIMAIIKIESKYNPRRVSKKGAVGLMQVMPNTAKWIIEEANFSKMAKEYLDEPDLNIELGSWYVNFLYKEFDNNLYATIAAYNAGPGNVRKWLNDGVWDGQKETIEKIPFGETRHYVQRVLYYQDKYRKIYEDEFIHK